MYSKNINVIRKKLKLPFNLMNDNSCVIYRCQCLRVYTVIVSFMVSVIRKKKKQKNILANSAHF